MFILLLIVITSIATRSISLGGIFGNEPLRCPGEGQDSRFDTVETAKRRDVVRGEGEQTNAFVTGNCKRG